MRAVQKAIFESETPISLYIIPETALMVTKGTPIAKYNDEIQNIGCIERVPEVFFTILNYRCKKRTSQKFHAGINETL